jgi:small subunit ribosomal protein S6
MYIVDPDLNSEQISAITSRYRQIVETNGGTVDRIDVWERRRLAYEIKGHTEGIYVIMYFRSDATVEAELRRVFQISEDQFRYIIVKPGEEAQGTGTPLSSEHEGRPAGAQRRTEAPVVEAELAPAESELAPTAAENAPETAEASIDDQEQPEGGVTGVEPEESAE